MSAPGTDDRPGTHTAPEPAPGEERRDGATATVAATARASRGMARYALVVCVLAVAAAVVSFLNGRWYGVVWVLLAGLTSNMAWYYVRRARVARAAADGSADSGTADSGSTDSGSTDRGSTAAK
jgi:hypothetical protein